jgi:NADPH:quinone reductase-like Zn-dependent oxidoreductase
MTPSTMKALKLVDVGKAEVQDVPLPKLRDTYVLVKVKAVALNPSDWKHVHFPHMAKAAVGCTTGIDYAGVVVEVGSKVTKDWKKGDRIAGCTHGSNSREKEDGAFAEFLVAKGDAGQLRIPDFMSDEDACTMSIGIVTVGQGLYQSLGLPLPVGKKASVDFLIYGGSTATGSLAIQYAVL